MKQQKSAAREAASISHQKLLKYLPQQTAGYSVGMTETAKIAANNSLQRQLAEADAAFDGSMADLNHYVAAEKDAAADKLYERERAEEQWNFQQDQWNYQKEQDTAAKQAAAQDFAFNSAVSAIEGMEFDTVDALQNYVTGLKGKVSEDQYKILENKMNYYQEGVAEIEADAKLAEADKASLLRYGYKVDATDDLAEDGENVEVKINGKWVETESGGVVPTGHMHDRLMAVLDGKPVDGEVFYVGEHDQHYLYHDGRFYYLDPGELGGAMNEDRLNREKAASDTKTVTRPNRGGVEPTSSETPRKRRKHIDEAITFTIRTEPKKDTDKERICPTN